MKKSCNKDKKNAAAKEKKTIQPFIAVGLQETLELFVIINNVKLGLNNLISALDYCFKTFFVFNLICLESKHFFSKILFFD